MLRSLLVAVAFGTLAVAAPVPKAPPKPSPTKPASFTLGTATLDAAAAAGPRLKFVYSRDTGVVPINGGPIAAVPRPLTQYHTLAAIKVTTADGTELTGDDLTKRLADPVAMVRSTTAFDSEWRKLFADDVLFFETNRAGGANPFAPGGGAVNPLPVVRPGGRLLPLRPAVLPVVPDEVPLEKPPAEKK